MKYLVLAIVIFSFSLSIAQEDNTYTHIFTPEFSYGTLAEPNENFPDTKGVLGLFLSYGKDHSLNEQEWAYRLNYPKTGLSVSAFSLGNKDAVGYSFSVLPYAEFPVFNSKKEKFNLHIGMGAAYFTEKYDPITNPYNQGVTTDITWSFRMFLYYSFLQSEKMDWRLGAGYFHQSNGHTKLPNQGFNSFLVSVSTAIHHNKETLPEVPKKYKRSTYSFWTVRTGIGQNVLSEEFNDKKEVYSFSVGYGKVINKTYKIGFGAYYRFYEHYYDYINDGESLVEEEYPVFMENPFGYASNFGFYGSGELLLNHIGVEFQLGLNIFKPAYKIDWKLNQGYSYEIDTEDGPVTIVQLGELDWYYEVKRTIMGRLGLKYYLFGTDNTPTHNVYCGVHINTNLGQADFTELSLGYVYSLNFK